MSIETEIEVLRNANIDLQNRLKAAEDKISTLTGYFDGAITETDYVSATSGGAVTKALKVVNGVIKS